MMRWLTAILIGLFLTAPAHATPAQRESFRAAVALIQRGADPADAGAQFGDYVLAPYLEYFYLRKHLRTVSAARVQRFLTEHDAIPAARLLRSAWLMHLGRTGRWNEFLAFWTPSRDANLRCYEVTARVRAGIDRDPALIDDILGLWMAGQSQPKACDPAFQYLDGRGYLTDARRFQRAMLAVDAGNAGLANYLSRRISGQGRAIVERGVDTLRDPARTLGNADRWQATEDHKRIVTAGLSVLVRRDSDAAARIWQRMRNHWTWDPAVKAYLDRRVTLLSATDFPDDALERLTGLSDAATDQTIHEWRVRVALHDQDWDGVIASIDAMPDALGAKARWRYWRARAMSAKGLRAEATQLFREVSEETNYYGFLAADRLQRSYQICPLPSTPDAADIDRLLANAALHRAVELFHIGEESLARSEWRLARRDLSPQQRRQAALYADSIGWHHQAIQGMGDAGARRYYSVRFPLGYQDHVTAAAQRRALEPALVYGILRSESAFAADAVSRVGAVGLMQLMPATATQVARSERLPYRGRRDLLNPARNIELGTAYLESLAARFNGHPLLVAAAYNAGPKAVERWLARREPVEPDIWIETLPYRETREYVSKVIAFTAIYDWRLTGGFQRLSHRMRNAGTLTLDRVNGRCEDREAV